MDNSLLVKMLGFPATMIHGDTMMVDRWLWLKSRLPRTRNGEKLLDLGCGTGAFTIGAAKRGYSPLGLSWDERNQRIAAERAAICGADKARFEVLDVRKLDTRDDLFGTFDVAVCMELIEHVLDDHRLLTNLVRCLKPGGRLLLTTPNYHYRALAPRDEGPFRNVEAGWHVRRGYSPAMLQELCEETGLICEDVSYCSGFVSQKVTSVFRRLTNIHPLVGWASIAPLRVLPLLLERPVTGLLRWPTYSICMEAMKPRFQKNVQADIGPTESRNPRHNGHRRRARAGASNVGQS